ncbi:MAG: lysophospholipid acyltransferase family protein, partial [Rhizomicrobium sp.]
MIFLRSVLFMAWFLAVTAAMSIVFLPLLALPRKASVWMARHWAGATLWGLRRFAGLGERLEGTAPKGPVLVAAKHMSMWDTLALYLALDDPAIVLKRELLRIPFYGWYLAKAAA